MCYYSQEQCTDNDKSSRVLSHVWWDVNQKIDCIEGFEDIGSHQDKQYCKSWPELYACFVVYVKSGSNQWLSIWFAGALSVRLLLFSWRRFLMPATMQDWYLLQPCLIWLSTISWLCNSWLLLKRHFLSGITINISQQRFKLLFGCRDAYPRCHG